MTKLLIDLMNAEVQELNNTPKQGSRDARRSHFLLLSTLQPRDERAMTK
jgi:hypothetical protein